MGGKNAQPKRQKCVPKKYTESEVRKKLLDQAIALNTHAAHMMGAACALALHRRFGFDQEQILSVLEGMDEIALESMSFSELRETLLEETGVDIKHWEEEVE